jgi:hypothetical protein
MDSDETFYEDTQGSSLPDVSTLPSSIDGTEHPELFTSNPKEAIIKLAAIVPIVKLYWSRSKWNKLSEAQRLICSTAWRGVDDETKAKWKKEFDAAKVPKAAAAPVDVNGNPLTNTNTNIHDRARLVHLLRDPSYATTWSSAHHVMNRAELDDKQCPPQHWNKLAAAFNDYDGVRYSNATILFDDEGREICCNPGMGRAYEVCKDINPTCKNRPERDGELSISRLVSSGAANKIEIAAADNCLSSRD